MSAARRVRPVTLYVLSLILLFLAANALYAGYSMLMDPLTGAPLGLQAEWLNGTPFANFTIPGLFLFFVFGVGSLFVLYALWVRPEWGLFAMLSEPTHEHWAWSAAFLLGAVLIAWIIIQVLLIRMWSPLQAVVAAMGVIIIVLDLLPATRRYYAR